jgi:WD40 repeat protein/serine/threonine protein kinase
MSAPSQPIRRAPERGDGLSNRPPPRIPDYELVRRIGEGSYGEVWLGKGVTGAYRAVKVVYRDRFDGERPYEREFRGIQKFEPISRLNQSHIDVLHVGRNDAEGYFYYVIELADDLHSINDGTNWDTYVPKTLKNELLRQNCLPFSECLELGLRLATALEHLHQNGLVHRDVKPSNIIFVSGAAKLADIGLVTSIDDSMSYVGTLGYLPPEGPGAPSADIYSLGKVLYEASTGKDRRDFPDLPTELEADADKQRMAELNEVILKACANQPSDRYRSASELKSELALLQSGKSVKGLRRLEQKLSVLKKVGITATVTSALAIAAFLYQKAEAIKVRGLANESRKRLVRLHISKGAERLDAGDSFRSLAWFAKALELDKNDAAAQAIDRVRIDSVLQQCPRLVAFGAHEGAIVYAEFNRDGSRIATASEDATARVWDALTSKPVGPPLRHQKTVRRVVFSADGQHVITASDDGTARIWDAKTSTPLGAPMLHKDRVLFVCFSPDGSKIVTTCADGSVFLWDSVTGVLLVGPLRHDGMVDWAAFSPDGKILATACRDHNARLWTPDTGQMIAPPMKHNSDVNQVVFSPDGQRLATACDDGGTRIWEVKSGRLLSAPLLQRGRVQALAFSPDGSRITTAGGLPGVVGTAQIWNTATGQWVAAAPLQNGPIFSAEFSPDGRWILLDGTDGAATICDSRTGEAVVPLLPHSQAVRAAALANDGRRVITASRDGTWRIWDLASEDNLSAFREFPHMIAGAQFDSTGDHFLAWERPKQAPDMRATSYAYVMKTSAPERELTKVAHVGAVLHAVFNAKGNLLLTIGADHRARVWDATTGKPISPILPEKKISYADFDKTDDHLIITTFSSIARIWNTSNWTPSDLILNHETSVSSATFSSDGTRVITSTCDWNTRESGQVRLWDVKTGRLIFSPLRHKGLVSSARFSPDERFILTSWSPPGEVAGGAELWDTQGGVHLLSMPHADGVDDAEFSADGRRIVTASEDRTARIWDSQSGAPVGQVMRHRRSVNTANFNRDGRFVVTGSHDGTARVWDANTGEPVTPPLQCGGMVWTAMFSPREDKILVGSGNWDSSGQVHLWTLPENDYSAEDGKQIAQLLSSASVDETGSLVPASKEVLTELWNHLREKQPKLFAANPAAIQSWYCRQERQCEIAQNWQAALFQIDECLKLAPGDTNCKAKRDELLQRLKAKD